MCLANNQFSAVTTFSTSLAGVLTGRYKEVTPSTIDNLLALVENFKVFARSGYQPGIKWIPVLSVIGAL
jgi:hypothetical protein